MPKSREYLEYVLEQLSGLGGITSNPMFGGTGLYQNDIFFALLFSDTLYFKVDDDSRPDYESRGMRRFQPYKDKPYLSFTYYEVPAEVLEDRDELAVWARKSVQAALAAAAAKGPRRKRAEAKSSKAKREKPSASAAKRAGPGGKRANNPAEKRSQPRGKRAKPR